MNLKELGYEGVDWTQLAEDRIQWLAHVNVVLKSMGILWPNKRLSASQEVLIHVFSSLVVFLYNLSALFQDLFWNSVMWGHLWSHMWVASSSSPNRTWSNSMTTVRSIGKCSKLFSLHWESHYSLLRGLITGITFPSITFNGRQPLLMFTPQF
jgi:hypothetical protein